MGRAVSSPGRITVRRARLRDAERLCELHHAAIRAESSSDYNPRQLAAWTYQTPAHFRWGLLQKDEWYIVAERAGRIVGFSSLKGEVLQAIYVDPQETRRGIGRKLVVRIEREARRRGMTRLRLKSSLNAVGFYRRLGYDGRRNGHLQTLEGVPLPYVAMKKELIPPVADSPAEATLRSLKEHSEANRRHRLHLSKGQESGALPAAP